MPDLLTLRHHRGLTIFEAAQRSGLTARAIAELEFGMRPIAITERHALAHVYDVAAEDLKVSQAFLASRSWQYLANILSRQLILAALVSITMAMVLFGQAVYGAEATTPVSSASPMAQAAGLDTHLSRPYLPAPTTSSRRRPQATLSHEKGAKLAVVPTAPTATPGSVPSVMPRRTHLATPQSTPTEVSDPVPTDVPSSTWAAKPELTPTDTSSLLPTEVPSVISSEVLDPVPTDALSPASTEALSPTPEAPSPTPIEAPSPTLLEAPSPAPEAPSPTPPEAPSPTPEAPSPIAPEAPSPGGAAASQENSVFMPLPAEGSFHQNVVAGLEANNGALQHVVIPPDGSWSFNRSIGDPDLLQLDSVYGVHGGGWCDLASRYLMVLRPLLPPESFAYIRHIDSTGYGLDIVAQFVKTAN